MHPHVRIQPPSDMSTLGGTLAYLGAQRADIREELERTPPTPDFSEYFDALPKLPRRVTVASPCSGT